MRIGPKKAGPKKGLESLDAGTTFLRSDSDKHLWIIISDPKVDADNE
jgi:hypothetical protein